MSGSRRCSAAGIELDDPAIRVPPSARRESLRTARRRLDPLEGWGVCSFDLTAAICLGAQPKPDRDRTALVVELGQPGELPTCTEVETQVARGAAGCRIERTLSLRRLDAWQALVVGCQRDCIDDRSELDARPGLAAVEDCDFGMAAVGLVQARPVRVSAVRNEASIGRESQEELAREGRKKAEPRLARIDCLQHLEVGRSPNIRRVVCDELVTALDDGELGKAVRAWRPCEGFAWSEARAWTASVGEANNARRRTCVSSGGACVDTNGSVDGCANSCAATRGSKEKQQRASDGRWHFAHERDLPHHHARTASANGPASRAHCSSPMFICANGVHGLASRSRRTSTHNTRPGHFVTCPNASALGCIG